MSQKKFAVICNDAGGAAPQTLVGLTSTTTCRVRVYGFDVGCSATPADQAALVVVARYTAPGTGGSTPTPTPLDNQEVASQIASGLANIAHSAEPTYTSPFLYQVALNQRASWRFVANPDYEFMAAATASNGIGLKRHTSTSNYALTGTIFFME